MPTVLASLPPVNVPPRLLPHARSFLAMLANRAAPWPDASGDWWIEASARFTGAALRLGHTVAHRLQRAIGDALGLAGLTARAARAFGIEVRSPNRPGPYFGTIWRIPAAVMAAIRAALATGDLDPWTPPLSGDRVWWEVEGVRPDTDRGTCFCPHPMHDGRMSRCAYQRHADGTYHLTCQLCRDGNGDPLTFYAVADNGTLRATMSARALLSGGHAEWGLPDPSSPSPASPIPTDEPPPEGAKSFVPKGRNDPDPVLAGEAFVPTAETQVATPPSSHSVLAVAASVGRALLARLTEPTLRRPAPAVLGRAAPRLQEPVCAPQAPVGGAGPPGAVPYDPLPF